MDPFHTIIFPVAVSSQTMHISSWVRTTNCLLYSNISYVCYINHGGIITNLNLWNDWGMLLICQNATMRVFGAWIGTYMYILCFMFKNIQHFWWQCSGSPLIRDGPLGAPAFVKLPFSDWLLQRPPQYSDEVDWASPAYWRLGTIYILHDLDNF